MCSHLVLVLVLFLLVHVVSPRPDFALKFSPTSAEGAWLWGWVWGPESAVSVVDHSPPLTFTARPATFGPELDDPLLGYVLPLSSFTTSCHHPTPNASNSACPPLCFVGPHRPDPKDPWIALVQRGHCTFVEKVREAQRLGARAVVVGGQDPLLTGIPDALINMYSKGDASDITIPSTYITFADYSDLIRLINASTTRHDGLNTLSLLISTHYSPWEWYSPILTFIVILILPSSLTFITLLIHRIRIARAAQRDRAPEHLVNSLPWRVWNGTAWEKHNGPPRHDIEAGNPSTPSPSTSHQPVPWCEAQLECAICLSEFLKGDRVRELPCHHIFHLDEVDAWLINRKKFCPVCKADVTQPWQLSLAKSPSPTPDPIQSAAPTERTPLLHDRHID